MAKKSSLTMSIKKVGSVAVKGDADFTREMMDAVMPLIVERSIRMHAEAKGISLEQSRSEHAAEAERLMAKHDKRMSRLAARPKRARRSAR